jgi:hypothetical protein
MAGSTSTHIEKTYRVTINVSRIQANVLACEGGRLTELAVRNWLRSVGFVPDQAADTWLATAETMRRLDKSEIVRYERVREGQSRATRRTRH